MLLAVASWQLSSTPSREKVGLALEPSSRGGSHLRTLRANSMTQDWFQLQHVCRVLKGGFLHSVICALALPLYIPDGLKFFSRRIYPPLVEGQQTRTNMKVNNEQ